jgi:hypothetical protein
MRIRFEVEGGLAAFPGLTKPITVDVDALAADEASLLVALVESAKLWEFAGGARPSPVARDGRTYRIELEDGARHHSAVFSDPVPGALAPLVRELSRRLKERS